MTGSAILEFYARHGKMDAPGRHAKFLAGAPGDLDGMIALIQGLLLHERLAPAYGVTLSETRKHQSHLRPISAMLDAILASENAPLAAARPPDRRLICVCRHYTLLLVAMLRAKGVPARARCGFGVYFERGRYLDHWVAEYWNRAEKRWILVDAQIDDVQRKLLGIDLDTRDVPRDRFLVAGDAWAMCRAGTADPQTFGILDMHGLWFIASNVLRDVAALNSMEMLPWDCWGAMTPDDRELNLELIDRLAAMTRAPDAHFAELRELYDADDRLRVPATVLNAVRNRPEEINPPAIA